MPSARRLRDGSVISEQELAAQRAGLGPAPITGGQLPPDEVAQRALAATTAAAAAANGAPGVVASALTVPAITVAAAGIIGSFGVFLNRRRSQQERYVNDLVEAEIPDLPEDQRLGLVSDELDREKQFAAKARARLDRDLPKALSIADAHVREAEVEKILDRERHYVQQREHAMAMRTLGAAEQQHVELLSPEGGYWHLSPHVKEHTLDCLAMGGKVWPHSVLRTYHPPLHGGCPCEILTIQEAEQQGFLTGPAQYATPDQSIHAMSVVESEFDREEFLDELGVLEAFYDARWGKGTTKAEQFRPRRGGDPGAALHHWRLARMRLPSMDAAPVRSLSHELDVRDLDTASLKEGDRLMVNGNPERVTKVHDKPGLIELEHTGLVYIDRATTRGIRGEGHAGATPEGPTGHLSHAVATAWEAMTRTGPQGNRLEAHRFADPENPGSKPSVIWALGKHASKMRATELSLEHAKRQDAKDRHAQRALDEAHVDLAKNIAQVKALPSHPLHDQALSELQRVHNAVTGGAAKPTDHGLPELPHYGPQDRFELRHGDNGSLIMWDREKNKPHAVWDHGWNLDDVAHGVAQDNAAHRLALQKREPPPVPPTGGVTHEDVSKVARMRRPAQAGQIIPSVHFNPDLTRSHTEGETLHLPPGYFKLGREQRHAVVFRHFGRRLSDSLGPEGMKQLGAKDAHLVSRKSVVDTYYALNSDAHRQRMLDLHPEASRLVAQAAHERGLPLHPEAAKLVRRPSAVEAPPSEHPAHALAKSLTGLSDRESDNRLQEAGYAYSAASKTPEGRPVLHYHNHDLGASVVTTHGEGDRVASARADIAPAVPGAERQAIVNAGQGENASSAVIAHMKAQGFPTYTTSGEWLQFVNPDGRGRAIRFSADSGSDRVGDVKAYTPTDGETRDARKVQIRTDPLSAVKPGDDANGILNALTHPSSGWRSGAQGTSKDLTPGSLPEGVTGFAQFTRRPAEGEPPQNLVLHFGQSADGTREIAAVGQGSLVHPHMIVAPAIREQELSSWRQAQADAERQRQEREAAAAQRGEGIRQAVASGDTKALQAALTGGGLNDAVRTLRQHGFQLRAQRRSGSYRDGRKITYTLRGPNAETVKLTGPYGFGVGNIEKVQITGNPQGGRRERLPQGQAPKNLDELLRDALGRADELGQRHDAAVHVTGISQSGVSRGAAATHEWNGTIAIRKQHEAKVIKSYLAKRAKGENLTESDHLHYYRAVQVIHHEINHGVGARGDGPGGMAFTPQHYRGLGVNVEEALTEETAHPLTAEWLRSHGMEDVLAAVKRHPDDYRVLGTYQEYRAQLRRLLDDAGVPEAERQALLERMKFQMTPQEQYATLQQLAGADALHRALHGPAGREQAARMRELRQNFQPILRPDLSDIDATPTATLPGGRAVSIGQEVAVQGVGAGEVVAINGEYVKVRTADGLELWYSVDRLS